VRRFSGWLAPLLLALAGVGLIIAGQLDLDRPVASLPPIPTPTPVAQATLSPATGGSPTVAASPSAAPTPTPIPDDVVAVQLEVSSVGINVAVREPSTTAECDFPAHDAAYLLCRTDEAGNLLPSQQPGRGTNSFIFAHAELFLFKPLWNVEVGAEVRILLSDGSVLRYLVTEVRPNVACPDDREPPHPDPPLALLYAGEGCEASSWTVPIDHERLTLQTSQGFNRNWGELVIVAEPEG